MKEYRKFDNADVEAVFKVCPALMRQKLMRLRELIFKTAAKTTGVGELEEALKWGEPSYITSQTKSGSTIRIDWKRSTPDQYYMYFNCKTTLIDSIKEIYADTFTYGGNRSIIFYKDGFVPIDALEGCIAMALTYNLTKKRR